MFNNGSEAEVLEEEESSEYEDGEVVSDEDNVEANEVSVKVDSDQSWKKWRKKGITTDYLSPEGINFFEDAKQKYYTERKRSGHKSSRVFLNIISSFLAGVNILLHCKQFSENCPAAQWLL